MAGKGDVINAIAEQAGISKKEAASAFDAFVGYISETCQSGERCAVPGLGSFSVSQRKAREGSAQAAGAPSDNAATCGVPIFACRCLNGATRERTLWPSCPLP